MYVADDSRARCGLVASSTDRRRVDVDVPNDFASTKRVHGGPSHGAAEDARGERLPERGPARRHRPPSSRVIVSASVAHGTPRTVTRARFRTVRPSGCR